jgi:hypothetical protein
LLHFPRRLQAQGRGEQSFNGQVHGMAFPRGENAHIGPPPLPFMKSSST